MDQMSEYSLLSLLIYDFFLIWFHVIKRTINQILRCLRYNLYHHSFHLADHSYFLPINLWIFYFQSNIIITCFDCFQLMNSNIIN